MFIIIVIFFHFHLESEILSYNAQSFQYSLPSISTINMYFYAPGDSNSNFSPTVE